MPPASAGNTLPAAVWLVPEGASPPGFLSFSVNLNVICFISLRHGINYEFDLCASTFYDAGVVLVCRGRLLFYNFSRFEEGQISFENTVSANVNASNLFDTLSFHLETAQLRSAIRSKLVVTLIV